MIIAKGVSIPVKRRAIRRIDDLIGRVVNSIAIRSFSHYVDKNQKRPVYNCECLACGKKILIRRSKLNNPTMRRNQQSCGCMKNFTQRSRAVGKTPGIRKTKDNLYIARITHNGTRFYLGAFRSFDDAVKAYDEKHTELFGSPYYNNHDEHEGEGETILEVPVTGWTTGQE